LVTGVKCSNLLRLEPPPLNNSRYVVRVDRKFRISCICQQTSINCMHLTWRNEFGRKIDGESSNSLFTIKLREHDSMYKKLSLVFTQIAKRDTGFYRCVARNSRRMSADWKVELIVVDEIHWKENNDIVGGMLGESLTIDCGSTGNPQPETHITNHKGLPLNETLFVTAGSEVTIKKLTNEYQDTIIKCLSVQEFEQYDATVVEEHEIRLDVWSSPKFSKSFVERFIVLDHLAQICCNVTRSNPPATHFRYLRGSNEIFNDSNHVVLTDALNQSSCLKILSPTEYDLGEYRCEVSNQKSKSQQTIAVKVAKCSDDLCDLESVHFCAKSSVIAPPGEVHVSLQSVGMTYVIWKIEEGFGEQLPIRRYIIEYIKKSILDQDSHDRTRGNNRVWFTYAIKMDVHLSKDGLYEVGGLRQGTMYLFRFAAENEAGIGDTVTVAVKTTSKIKLSKLTRSSSSHFQQLTFYRFFSLLFSHMVILKSSKFANFI
uniref:Fibronectin type III domain protein n=1 Tax=Onchocerca flexuosa TaxID=387005 RepID=A0A183I2I0_9BILA